MSFFRKGIVATLLIVVALFLSGCITPTPEPTDEQSPGAVVIPVPIPGNYLKNGSAGTSQLADGSITNAKMGNSAVNDSTLAANAIPTNYTFNSSTIDIVGTAFLNATNGSKITLNRASLLQITFSGMLNSTGTVYMRSVIDNVELPGAIMVQNATSTTLVNSTSLTWVNGSLYSGTHNVWVQANTSAGTLTLRNTTLLLVAYPR